ncbi:MAG: single-stranded-DNA-specific exonuclease RecJ, partial [Legionellales bacterium]
ADNGSSDEPRIKLLKANGIDVIVTDHHDIPKTGYPVSAYACLNPRRDDCNYPDPYIAGCMVAWLLMTTVRSKLIIAEHLPVATKSLVDSLDFVAVGTIADCVSMARSLNNRIVVHYGLQLINRAVRPCWQAIKSTIKNNISVEDLGFQIGPLLNSDGRLRCAFKAVSFLLANNISEATTWVVELQEQNTERKKIQKHIVTQGIELALQQVAANSYALSIFLTDSHPGVHGIAASRIKDLFGRPTIFLAKKQGDTTEDPIITGSARGIDNFHVCEALQEVAIAEPDLLLAFGGHKGAGGLTLKKSNLALFYKHFEQATRKQLTLSDLGPIIWTDGSLQGAQLSMELVAQLDKLQPFGREFEAPLFELQGMLLEFKPVGDGTHARLLLELSGTKVAGIWFGMRKNSTDPLPVAADNMVTLVAAVAINEFRGFKSLQLNIAYMQYTD